MVEQAGSVDMINTCASDPVAFAANLHLELGGKVRRFGDVWYPCQRDWLKAVAPLLLAISTGDVAEVRKFWLEATKGYGKDMLITIAGLWLLLFSRRSIRIQIGAGDQQQASEPRLITKQIVTIDAPLNRLVASKIDIQQYRLIGHASTPGRLESVAEILTTDASSSHGSRPDLVVCNELTHVDNEAFVQTMMDNAAKIPHSGVLIATNSGTVGSFQEKWRDNARESETWNYTAWNTPAPHISEADLADSVRRNPPQRHARLFLGQWSSGDGDGLNPNDIARLTLLAGPQQRRYDRIYAAGLDLGVKNDHSALCIVGVDPINGVVEVVNCISWRPEDNNGTIDLMQVEAAVLLAHKVYDFTTVKYDPWQCHLMAQRLAMQGVPTMETVFTPENRNIMARALLRSFTDGLIRLYPDPAMARDLLRLRIKESPFGFSLSAIKDASGHADRAIALSIILPAALYEAHHIHVQEPPAEEWVA